MLFQVQGKFNRSDNCKTQEFSKAFEHGNIKWISKFYKEITTSWLYEPDLRPKSVEIKLVTFFTSGHFVWNLASDVLFPVFLYFSFERGQKVVGANIGVPLGC